MTTIRAGIIATTFLLSSINPALADAPQASQRAVNHVDKLINQGQKQLTNIRISLNGISALIRKKDSYNKEQVNAAIKHLTQLDQMVVGSLKNEKFIQADLESAFMLLQINNALIDHLHWLLNNNFKNVQEFDFDAFLAKALTRTKKTLEPHEILRRLVINEKKIEQLMVKAQGLTWYNKVARFLDDWAITPANKYSIPSRAMLASTIGAFVALGFWHSGKMQNSPLGEVPVNDRVSNTVVNADKINNFGATYNFISGMMGGMLPIPTYLLGAGTAAFSLEFKNNIYPWLQKKGSELKNNLKGGAYVKEAERIAETVKQVRFDDIHGQDEIKRYLKLLVDYLEDPETFDRLGLTPPKGILCIGDTRTGKTHAISALFGEINERRKQSGQTGKFKLIPLSALIILKVGMEAILHEIRKSAPCIIFIDEIDLLDLQRRGENKTLSEFLTAMSDALDSKDSNKQVIIIAATNRPETLDIALRQPGRFGKELRFEYPNYNDRHSFITMKLDELSLTSEQFDIDKIARFTENKSYEAMNMVIKNAIIKARMRQELLTQAHLDEAIDEDIYHIIPKYTKHVPEQERKILAAHFAGQAALLALGKTDIKLAKATIKQVMTELKEEMMGMHLYQGFQNKENKEQQRFEYGKIFTHHTNDSINITNKEEKLALIRMYLAGFIAEELLLGSCGYSCHAEDDTANALAYAQSITFQGIDISKMPEHIREKMHSEALALIEECRKDARTILEQNKDLVQTLSDELMHKETLDEVQVNEIVQKFMSKEAQ